MDTNFIQFYYKGKSITARIKAGPDGYFLGNIYEKQTNMLHNNDYLFQLCRYDTMLKKKALYLKILGYWPRAHVGDTYWPWCETVEDVKKIVIYLVKKLIGNAKFIDLRLHLI